MNAIQLLYKTTVSASRIREISYHKCNTEQPCPNRHLFYFQKALVTSPLSTLQIDGKTLDTLGFGKAAHRGQTGPGAQRFAP